jgi:hypothetical protein
MGVIPCFFTFMSGGTDPWTNFLVTSIKFPTYYFRFIDIEIGSITVAVHAASSTQLYVHNCFKPNHLLPFVCLNRHGSSYKQYL